jgi:hypothetical protein
MFLSSPLFVFESRCERRDPYLFVDFLPNMGFSLLLLYMITNIQTRMTIAKKKDR